MQVFLNGMERHIEANKDKKLDQHIARNHGLAHRYYREELIFKIPQRIALLWNICSSIHDGEKLEIPPKDSKRPAKH